jgi:FkbM family methyltransferase
VSTSSIRQALWPLASTYRRLRSREPVLEGSYEGVRFFYPARSEIGAALAQGRGWDRMLRAILAEVVGGEPGVVADVGANIGASLIEMKLAAPNARFHCYEPSSRFLRALRRTVEANGWTDVRVTGLALGAADEHCSLYVNATTASVVAAFYGERTPLGAQRIAITTLDSEFAGEGRLDFLKIDTDGFELDVLLGGQGVLRRHRPALFFELDPGLLAWGGRDSAALLNLLDDLGYRSFRPFAPGGASLPAVDGVSDLADTLAAAPGHLNVLALRPRR